MRADVWSGMSQIEYCSEAQIITPANSYCAAILRNVVHVKISTFTVIGVGWVLTLKMSAVIRNLSTPILCFANQGWWSP